MIREEVKRRINIKRTMISDNPSSPNNHLATCKLPTNVSLCSPCTKVKGKATALDADIGHSSTRIAPTYLLLALIQLSLFGTFRNMFSI